MMTRTMMAIAGLVAASALTAAPVAAKTIAFTVSLNGIESPTATGSAATGVAVVKVDLDRKLVSVSLTVDGIARDGLWDRLVAAPIGPIHFHKYGSHNHSGDDVVLVLPVPYGPTYHATRDGFRVSMPSAPYEAGAKLLNSTLSFGEFVSAMKSGQVILNIHTDAFNDGEISGTVRPR